MIIIWTPLTQQLVDKLKTLKVYSLTTNKKEISVRCPHCGDSYKHSNSSHLYIKLDVQDGEPHTYYCQRCQAKGIVNADFLKQLKIYDTDLNVAIGINLKNLSKSNKNIYIIKKSTLSIPEVQPTKLSYAKLNYINKRLGTSIMLDELKEYKIFLHLYDLLDENHITYLTCKDDMAEKLDHNFLGFISYDCNYAIMRNLSKKSLSNMRYYNYNIRGNYDNSKRFYIIPTKIDVTAERIKVCIAEGIMDILGIYHNIEKEHDNVIFAAVCGTGYNNVIREIVKLTGCLDLDIKFYSDNDQKPIMFKKIKSEFPFLNDTKCELIYNTLEKDYGVTPDKIKLKRSYI